MCKCTASPRRDDIGRINWTRQTKRGWGYTHIYYTFRYCRYVSRQLRGFNDERSSSYRCVPTDAFASPARAASSSPDSLDVHDHHDQLVERLSSSCLAPLSFAHPSASRTFLGPHDRAISMPFDARSPPWPSCAGRECHPLRQTPPPPPRLRQTRPPLVWWLPRDASLRFASEPPPFSTAFVAACILKSLVSAKSAGERI